MELRSVTERMIKEALENPDETSESFRERRIVYKKFGSQTLKIPLIVEHGTATIISVIWKS